MKLFEKTVEKANIWIKDTMVELGAEDPHQALHALRAGLHALRDRLTVDEAAQLSAQLPLLIRGLYFEDWRPAGKPLRIRHKAEFLALIREKYAPRTDLPAEEIMAALFRVLQKHVSVGELTDIVMSLPSELMGSIGGRVELEE